MISANVIEPLVNIATLHAVIDGQVSKMCPMVSVRIESISVAVGETKMVNHSLVD